RFEGFVLRPRAHSVIHFESARAATPRLRFDATVSPAEGANNHAEGSERRRPAFPGLARSPHRIHRARRDASALRYGPGMRARSGSALLAVELALFGCNRRIDPFDPKEEPRQPDLSQIFPDGSERAESPEPGLPAPPDGGRGAASVAAESGAPIRGTVRI